MARQPGTFSSHLSTIALRCANKRFERQKIKLNERRFFASVLHPDYPVSVGSAHCARYHLEVLAMFGHQQDGIRPVILDDEVAALQSFRK
jgi:hypothetical protein